MTDQIKIDFEKIIKNLELTETEVDLKKKSLNKFIENGSQTKNWKTGSF